MYIFHLIYHILSLNVLANTLSLALAITLVVAVVRNKNAPLGCVVLTGRIRTFGGMW